METGTDWNGNGNGLEWKRERMGMETGTDGNGNVSGRHWAQNDPPADGTENVGRMPNESVRNNNDIFTILYSNISKSCWTF